MMKNFILVLLLGLLIGAITAYVFVSKNTSPAIPTYSQNQTVSISGTISVNGVIPNGATVTLEQWEHAAKSSPKAFASDLAIQDSMPWTFAQAKAGKSYEIQAIVKVNGKELAHSDPHYVTAPATDEVLELNIQSQESNQPATISGTIGINGYIPVDSTVTVEGREEGISEYTPVAQDLPAQDGQFLSYTSAIAGKSYEIQALLYNAQGQQIGKSAVLEVTAPAINEKLEINSTAKPPVTPTPQQLQATPTPAASSISGTINFNGAALPNSRVVIFQRVSGTSNFQVAVDNITPVDGVKWQWNGAQTGATYDTIAILKQRQANGTDNDISTSNTITAAAPATNEVFTINSGYSLPTAGGTISVTCGNKDQGSNTWGASVSFQSVPNAQSYWFQIGTTNGGTELSNFTQNATNNPTQSFNVQLKNGTTYYARYAYAMVQNVAAGSSQFSPFSSTTQLLCNQ